MLEAGRLWSDAQRIAQTLDTVNIGHSHIKERRRRRAVSTSAGGMLGDYVPFNFCSRSVMLYVIHRGAVDGYEGGQVPVVHLVSSVEMGIRSHRPWAFTDRHADLKYAKYFESIDDEGEVDWSVMRLKYWSNDENTKEKRQAEFLLHDWCPFSVIGEISVINQEIANQVKEMLDESPFSPRVAVRRSWYY